MTKQNPFDAAIETLRFSLIGVNLKQHVEKMIKFSKEEKKKQAEAAIRLLEAAGKVDKMNCIVELVGCNCRYCSQLRALLSALPDEAKP